MDWMAEVLTTPHVEDQRAASESVVNDRPPLEAAPFDKGDVGAYRTLAYLALAGEWMEKAGVAEDAKEREQEAIERIELPPYLRDKDCRYASSSTLPESMWCGYWEGHTKAHVTHAGSYLPSTNGGRSDNWTRLWRLGC